MSELEPGLDLHEWETRWAELEELLEDDPAEALVEACDEIEELLRLRRGGIPDTASPELDTAYESARDVANRVEAGEDVGPGDVGAAVESLRMIRAALIEPGEG